MHYKLHYKLLNILIGSIYFLASVIVFVSQRIICEMYQANMYAGRLDEVHNLGGLLYNWYSDLLLYPLSALLFVIGIYFTFFSSIGEPK